MTVFTNRVKNTSTFTNRVKNFLAYFLATQDDKYITTESGLKLVVGEDNSFVNQVKH